MLEFTLLIYAVSFFIAAIFCDGEMIIYATACVIHEAGHLVCAKFLCLKAASPNLKPFTAVIEFISDNRLNTALVALSGPFANLLASAVCLTFFRGRLYAFSVISFFTAIINLMPVYPLDGSVALESIIPNSYKHKILYLLSDFFLISFCLTASYRMLRYGDSLFVFLFSLRCVFLSEKRRIRCTDKNHIQRIKENSRV